MAGIKVSEQYPIFTNDAGIPVENGHIYIGASGLDPIASPIAVYWDVDLTIPASQPIRTVGGAPSWNGKPRQIFVQSNYSISVTDSNGASVFYDASYVGVTTSSETQTATSLQTVFTLTSMKYQNGLGLLDVFIDGVHQNPAAYTETSSTVVTFSTGVPLNASVLFKAVSS